MNEVISKNEYMSCLVRHIEDNLPSELDADLLLSMARDNGMVADKKGIFAVYDAKVSFDNLSIKMYCPVKIDTK